MADTPNNKGLLWLVIIVLIGIAVYGFLNLPDHRTTNEKIGDAIHDMDPKQLENRTPGEKLGDAIKKDTNANQ